MNAVHVNVQAGQIIVLMYHNRPIGYFTTSSRLMTSVKTTWSTHPDYVSGQWSFNPSSGGKGTIQHTNGHTLDYKVVWLDEEHM